MRKDYDFSSSTKNPYAKIIAVRCPAHNKKVTDPEHKNLVKSSDGSSKTRHR